jgi:hypothetical protein
MTDVRFHHRSPCPPTRIRGLLLDERFLEAFVKRQHPNEHSIEVDRDARVATIRWRNEFGHDVPGLVQSLVGHKVAIELRINANEPGRLDLDATAKRNGQLRAVLDIAEEDPGSAVTISGSVTVSGFMGGLAAGQASGQVIEPIMNEDLFPLLDEWCDR